MALRILVRKSLPKLATTRPPSISLIQSSSGFSSETLKNPLKTLPPRLPFTTTAFASFPRNHNADSGSDLPAAANPSPDVSDEIPKITRYEYDASDQQSKNSEELNWEDTLKRMHDLNEKMKNLTAKFEGRRFSGSHRFFGMKFSWELDGVFRPSFSTHRKDLEGLVKEYKDFVKSWKVTSRRLMNKDQQAAKFVGAHKEYFENLEFMEVDLKSWKNLEEYLVLFNTSVKLLNVSSEADSKCLDKLNDYIKEFRDNLTRLTEFAELK